MIFYCCDCFDTVLPGTVIVLLMESSVVRRATVIIARTILVMERTELKLLKYACPTIILTMFIDFVRIIDWFVYFISL